MASASSSSSSSSSSLLENSVDHLLHGDSDFAAILAAAPTWPHKEPLRPQVLVPVAFAHPVAASAASAAAASASAASAASMKMTYSTVIKPKSGAASKKRSRDSAPPAPVSGASLPITEFLIDASRLLQRSTRTGKSGADAGAKIAAINGRLRPLLAAVARAEDKNARLAAVRALVETALLLIAGVSDANAGTFLDVLRIIMPVLSDETLGFFAQSGQHLALLLGKGEHDGESAMAGRGGATAQMVSFVQAGCREVNVSVGVVDVDPYFAASRHFSAGGRITVASSALAQKLAATIMGVLFAAAEAGGNKIDLCFTMLGGGAHKIWKIDFPLLRGQADRALGSCRGVEKDGQGRHLIDGGPHWSVCWARMGSGAAPLCFMRETMLASCAGDGNASKAQAKKAKALMLRAAAAGRAAAEASDLRFAPLIAIVLDKGAVELVTRNTDVDDKDAAALVTSKATARMLEDVPGAAVLVTLLEGALGVYAVRAGTNPCPGLQIGGFSTTHIFPLNFTDFMSGLAEDTAPGGARDVPFPSSMAVIATDLVQGMTKDEEFFTEIGEYMVYAVTVAVIGRNVRAYGGSAGHAGIGCMASYSARTDRRNSFIKNHGGVGDSNLGIYVASLLAEIAAGTLTEKEVSIKVRLIGISVPAGALPVALGCSHALGLFAEQVVIIGLWPSKACLNGSHVALKIDTGFDSASATSASESSRGARSMARGLSGKPSFLGLARPR